MEYVGKCLKLSVNQLTNQSNNRLINQSINQLMFLSPNYNNNNNNNNNNIYRGSPTRQGGFQWGPHALI